MTSDGVLAPEHDAAHVKWGGAWRMPTYAEVSALINNCDQTWTTQNGVNGYVVRGRGAYASNGIFLPSAGYSGYSYLNVAGSGGYYWSSSPDPFPSYSAAAWDLFFTSGYFPQSESSRFIGQSVRPVQGFTE